MKKAIMSSFDHSYRYKGRYPLRQHSYIMDTSLHAVNSKDYIWTVLTSYDFLSKHIDKSKHAGLIPFSISL